MKEAFLPEEVVRPTQEKPQETKIERLERVAQEYLAAAEAYHKAAMSAYEENLVTSSDSTFADRAVNMAKERASKENIAEALSAETAYKNRKAVSAMIKEAKVALSIGKKKGAMLVDDLDAWMREKYPELCINTQGDPDYDFLETIYIGNSKRDHTDKGEHVYNLNVFVAPDGSQKYQFNVYDN